LTGGIKGLRIGVPSEYFFDAVNKEAAAAAHRAIAVLKKLGAVVVEVKVRNAELAGTALWIIQMSEAASFHEKRLREHADLFEPLVRERLEVATFFSAVEYIKSQRLRAVLIEEMRRVFEMCDVMAVPAGNPATRLDLETVDTDAMPGSSPGPRRETWSIGNMTGIPAIVQPCGFTEGSPALPLGIQFYAKPFDELTLFRVGHAYEAATDWHARRPPTS
jgi:aspartyl-tRNA(Asn)/glutamyl-tRNA(Gln) amidotransferase subunit A